LGSINDPELSGTSFAVKGGMISTVASGPHIALAHPVPPAKHRFG
jgi:hypothetical protein